MQQKTISTVSKNILFEIQNQLKVVEGQAKKAEKYHEIKKEYKLVSVELAKAALEGFNLTYKELNKQQEEETDKKHALEAAIATGEAELEKDRTDFITQEKALQQQQHHFNELVQQLRLKENEKNLANQRLHYLKEKDASLKEFLVRASGQLKNIEDSIQYTQLQQQKEEQNLEQLKEKLAASKTETEAKRVLLDEKRASTDKVRSTHLQTQRKQFDAEKKVAVAETSVHNIQRSLTQAEQEQQNRSIQIKQLDEDVAIKAKALEEKQQSLQQLKEQHELTRQQILQSQSELKFCVQNLLKKNRNLMQNAMNMIF